MIIESDAIESRRPLNRLIGIRCVCESEESRSELKGEAETGNSVGVDGVGVERGGGGGGGGGG